VLVVAGSTASDADLLRRMLAADLDSLLRRATNGTSALHFAAAANTDALKQLLGSGLPHLATAIDAVAVQPPKHGIPAAFRISPLHCACRGRRWDAALALLAAGARVDIAADIDGRLQTIAEWARSSPECKHRGVKLAVAARAREHAAQAAAAAKGLSVRRRGVWCGGGARNCSHCCGCCCQCCGSRRFWSRCQCRRGGFRCRCGCTCACSRQGEGEAAEGSQGSQRGSEQPRRGGGVG
jgi:hypothetical protein